MEVGQQTWGSVTVISEALLGGTLNVVLIGTCAPPVGTTFDILTASTVTGSFDAPVVQVVNESGDIEDRPVVLGNNDEFWVAVREGVSDGERVVLQGSGTSTQQFDFRQAFRQFGNFGGGGGGGRGRDGGGGGGGRGRGGG